jgi:hypothetical protein
MVERKNPVPVWDGVCVKPHGVRPEKSAAAPLLRARLSQEGSQGKFVVRSCYPDDEDRLQISIYRLKFKGMRFPFSDDQHGKEELTGANLKSPSWMASLRC